MLIATKYEEIQPPQVRDYVFITDNAYTKDDILQCEYQMLTTLEFNITAPSAFTFLERFAKVANLSPLSESMAYYLIELPLIEQRMLKFSPSMIGASAVFLSLRVNASRH